MSRIEDSVINQIKMRAIRGENKYNTTMERDDLNLAEWLQHLQEELLDAAVYVEKLKEETKNSLRLQDWQEEIIAKSKEDDTMYFMPCNGHAKQQEEDECDGELGSHPLCCTDYCPCKEEEIEKRMNIIGQNGNTGEHYTLNINEATVTVATPHVTPCGWDNTLNNIEVNYEVQEKEREENN